MAGSEARNELRRLADAGRRLGGAADPAAFARAVLDVARDLLGAKAGAVFLPDAFAGQWTCEVSAGLERETIEQAEDLLAGGEAQDLSPAWQGWASVHEVALGPPTRPLGLLVVLGDAGGFAAEGRELLDLLMPQVSAALQGANALSRSQQLVARFYTLHELSKILTTTLDVDQVTEVAADALLGTVGAAGVALLLKDPDRPELVLAQARHLPVPAGTEVRVAFGEGRLGEIAMTRVPWREEELGSAERAALLPGVPMLAAETAMAAPLICRGELLGVFLAVQERAGIFSDDQLKLMAVVANQVAAAVANARSHGHAQRLLGFFYNLHELSKFVSSSLALDQVTDFVCDALAGMTGATHVGLFLPAPPPGQAVGATPAWNADQYVLAASRGFSRRETPYAVTVGEGPIGRALADRQPVLVEGDRLVDWGAAPAATENQVRSLLVAPLVTAKGVMGALLVGQTRPGAFGPMQRQMLAITATQVATAVSNAQLFGKVAQMASTDGLTGLYNHRFFQDALRRALETYHRYGRNFSLLLTDIDHFKRVNDEHGHQAGDQVLVQVARRFARVARTSDLVARYGGEELAVLLPETDFAGALSLAERLRATMADAPFDVDGEPKLGITISIGVATCTRHGTTAEALIEHADRCLYRAKAEGRNRVGSGP